MGIPPRMLKKNRSGCASACAAVAIGKGQRCIVEFTLKHENTRPFFRVGAVPKSFCNWETNFNDPRESWSALYNKNGDGAFADTVTRSGNVRLSSRDGNEPSDHIELEIDGCRNKITIRCGGSTC